MRAGLIQREQKPIILEYRIAWTPGLDGILQNKIYDL
jgi:hypothetical protein